MYLNSFIFSSVEFICETQILSADRTRRFPLQLVWKNPSTWLTAKSNNFVKNNLRGNGLDSRSVPVADVPSGLPDTLWWSLWIRARAWPRNDPFPFWFPVRLFQTLAGNAVPSPPTQQSLSEPLPFYHFDWPARVWLYSHDAWSTAVESVPNFGRPATKNRKF